jgi:hypothetical protein
MIHLNVSEVLFVSGLALLVHAVALGEATASILQSGRSALVDLGQFDFALSVK